MFPVINGKSFMECNDEDLKVLINNPEYRENEYIDYKLTFSFLECEKGDVRNKKKDEFKTDICSFANSNGGYLIFGVKDENNNGYATELQGIDIPDNNIDKFELDRRNDLMSILPRIPYIQFKFIKLKNDKYIVIIFIKHDSFAPYLYLQNNKNYIAFKRVGNKKTPMSYLELKNMFNQSILLDREIYNYRMDRINYYKEQSEIEDDSYSKFLLLHIIPETFIDSSYNKNMFLLDRSKKMSLYKLFNSFAAYENYIPCADGLRFLPTSEFNKNAQGYINNNGVIEYFIPLKEFISSYNNTAQKYIQKNDIWSRIETALSNYNDIFKDEYCNNRILICLSIIGCKGILSETTEYTHQIGSIDRNNVICEPVIIEKLNDFNTVELAIKKLHIEYLLSIGVQRDENLNEIIKEIYNC